MNYNKKIIIGFDLDGVILDHLPGKLRLVRKYGFNLDKTQMASETISRLVPLPAYKLFKHDLYDNPKTALNVPLMSGVKIFLTKIKKENIPFSIVSARKTTDIPVQILKKHKLWPSFFNNRNVIFVPDKKDKNNQAKTLGITHYIDDEPEVFSMLPDVKNKYLFDPTGVFKHLEYTRIKSWEEAYPLIFTKNPDLNKK